VEGIGEVGIAAVPLLNADSDQTRGAISTPEVRMLVEERVRTRPEVRFGEQRARLRGRGRTRDGQRDEGERGRAASDDRSQLDRRLDISQEWSPDEHRQYGRGGHHRHHAGSPWRGPPSPALFLEGIHGVTKSFREVLTGLDRRQLAEQVDPATHDLEIPTARGAPLEVCRKSHSVRLGRSPVVEVRKAREELRTLHRRETLR